MKPGEERAWRVFIVAVFVLPFAGLPAALMQNTIGWALTIALVVVVGALAITPSLILVLSPLWAPVLWLVRRFRRAAG